MVSSSQFKGEEIFIFSNDTNSRKSLRVFIAERKYPQKANIIKRTHLVTAPVQSIHDFRNQNLTILAKEAYNYQEVRPMLEEVGRRRVEKAVEKGVFKERMSAEYSKKLMEKNMASGREASSLDEKDVAVIRELAKNESQAFLASKYNVSRATIADIVNYRIWNEHAFSPEDMRFLVDDNYVVVQLDLKEYDRKIHEFSMTNTINKEIYTFGNGYQYILKKQVEDQICLFKFDSEGNYMSDSHIRFVVPSHRNDWRNFAIISMRGNHSKNGYMDRKEIYDVLYTLNLRLRNVKTE